MRPDDFSMQRSVLIQAPAERILPLIADFRQSPAWSPWKKLDPTIHNVTDFSLAPASGGTEVTWLMRGPSPFVSKVMGVFIDMDKMIGKDFAAGLANLKATAEKGNA